MQLAQTTLNFYDEAVNQQLPGVTAEDVAASDRGFGALIGRFLGMTLTVAGLLLLFYLIWGGIEWITSGGDKGKVEKARNKITQAVIGLLVILASVALLNLIQSFFGFSVLNFSNNSNNTQVIQSDRPFCRNNPCADGYICVEATNQCIPNNTGF